MNFFIFIFSMIYSFPSLIASEVTFTPASKHDTLTIRSHMVSFYSQGLIEAGLFTDQKAALDAAEQEILEDEKNNASQHYFHLTSTECEKTYFGYIVYTTNVGTAYIEALYLDEQYRGQGLGKATLCHLEKKLTKLKINSISLYVFAHNQAACDLYKKMGYTIENSYFRNESPLGYHMKKTLLHHSNDPDLK